MSKIRVHELAKQLDVNSKALIDKLTHLGVDVKNHMSSVSAEEAAKITSLFKRDIHAQEKGPGREQSHGQNQSKAQAATAQTDIKSRTHTEGKSMNIQPAETTTRTQAQTQTQTDAKNGGEPQQSQPAGSMEANRPSRPQPQGDRPDYQGQGNRPQGDRPPRPQGDRPGYQGQGRPQGDRPPRPQGDRPGYQGQGRPQGDRPPRPQGDRPGYQGQGNRPQGDRPPRPQGDRPGYQGQGNRPQGDRPPRPQGDRPGYQGQGRPQGDRPGYQGQGRPQGDRPGYQGQGRPQGDRPGYQGQGRPQGDRPGYQGQGRPQGDRPGYQGQGRPQGDRPGYQGQGRPQGDRPGYQGQGNRPYGDRPPRPQGDRPGYQGQGRPQGGYRGGNTIDDKLRAFEKSKDRSAAPATEKPDKEHSRRLNKPPLKPERKAVPKDSEKPMAKPLKTRPMPKPVSTEPKILQVPAEITVKQLAEKMNVAGNDVIKMLIKKGKMVTVNEEINLEMAAEIAEVYNFLVEEAVEVDLFEENFGEEPDDEADMRERPPVVVVMGHVDHGKTSLLDAIRDSTVTEGEAGGITQHIGAYTVEINGKPITFLDTPGHEAFTAMRMRGAQVTDIAVLVVAADDGVMPQTIEAISHAKAAGVDIMVAINKIDKPSANPDRVKQELTEYGLVTEEWGGETICVPVSALNRTGIDQLLEMIILNAEMKELKANPNKKARGTIIEAQLDKGRGPVATVLVQSGTLQVGDPVVAGGAYGKIRAMTDDKGKKLKSAGPSVPVEILGLSEVPQAGDMFYVALNDKHARQVAEAYVAKGRVEMTKSSAQKVSLDDLFNQIRAGNVKELNIIVKADVQGSVEAVRQSLEKLSNDEVRVRILHGGVGAINESDVMLATTSGAIIIGFNVRPETMAKSVADEQGVDMRLYRVIYSAIEDVQAAMKGMLDPIYQEKVIGHAEIRQIFKASSVGNIAGSYVLDGKIIRNAKVRITRDNVMVYEGTLETVKRFKDDVKEVATGYECGLLFTKFNDIKEGDLVEAYIIEEVER